MTTLTVPNQPASGKSTAAAGVAGLKIHESGRSVIVRVLGPLDLERVPLFLGRLEPLCTTGRRVVLDLLHADYVDSSGVRAILQLQSQLAELRGELRLVIRTGSRVERVFSLLRLIDQLDVYQTVSEAWEGRKSVS